MLEHQRQQRPIPDVDDATRRQLCLCLLGALRSAGWPDDAAPCAMGPHVRSRFVPRMGMERLERGWGRPCTGILHGRFGEPSVRRLVDGTWAMAYLNCATGCIV